VPEKLATGAARTCVVKIYAFVVEKVMASEASPPTAGFELKADGTLLNPVHVVPDQDCVEVEPTHIPAPPVPAMP
jgi:hypothetical protein